MKFLKWLQACLIVYSGRLVAMSSKTRLQIIMIVTAVLVASVIGLVATVVVLVVSAIMLPLLNDRVKADIDREYSSHNDHQQIRKG